MAGQRTMRLKIEVTVFSLRHCKALSCHKRAPFGPDGLLLRT